MAEIINTYLNSKFEGTPSQPFTDVTNTHMTPPRAAQWHSSLRSPIRALDKGTQACTFIVGEANGRSTLAKNYKQTENFRMKVIQREVINLFYRIVGGSRQVDELEKELLAELDASRVWFYEAILLERSKELQAFLHEHSPLPDINADRVLALVNPKKTIKTANENVHQPTFADLYYALNTMSEHAHKLQDPKIDAEVHDWKMLFCFTTGRTDVPAWEHDGSNVKERCNLRSLDLVSDPFRMESERLNKGKSNEMKNRQMSKLEEQGLIVSPKTLKKVRLEDKDKLNSSIQELAETQEGRLKQIKEELKGDVQRLTETQEEQSETLKQILEELHKIKKSLKEPEPPKKIRAVFIGGLMLGAVFLYLHHVRRQ